MEGHGTFHCERGTAYINVYPRSHVDKHAESHLDLQPGPVRDVDSHRLLLPNTVRHTDQITFGKAVL